MVLNETVKDTPLGTDEAIIVADSSPDICLIWEWVSIKDGVASPFERMTRGQVGTPIGQRHTVWRVQGVKEAPYLGVPNIHVGNTRYGPCEGKEMAVVELHAGDVIYIGEWDLKSGGAKSADGIVPTWSFSNFKVAKEVLAMQSQALADKLQSRQVAFYKTDIPCRSGGVTIPIYIGR